MRFNCKIVTLLVACFLVLSSCCREDTCTDPDRSIPSFLACLDVEDMYERKSCQDKKLLEAVYRRLRYPKEAKENGIEGTVALDIFVEKSGQVNEIIARTDFGFGLEEECIRVLFLVSEEVGWMPALEDCSPIRTTFTMPIKFKL